MIVAAIRGIHSSACGGRMRSTLPAVQIRDADPVRDAAACAAIYGVAVRSSAASFEQDPPGETEMASRMSTVQTTHPWLVAEHDGELAGYAYGSRHAERAAYRWAANVSVYVAEDHRRRGAARALYEALLQRLTAQGLRMACAGIALPNPASVALHESLGFRAVGTYARIGFKFGRWWDVRWYQLPLGAGDPDAPPAGEPRPPRG
jgi:L-amino acid N-acyltransferase YncA